MRATGVASRRHESRLTGSAAGAGLLVTVTVIAVPALRDGYHVAPLHIALETANGLIAGLTAYLIYGRFRRTKLVRSLLLVYGLALLAISGAVLAPLSQHDSSTLWASLALRVLAAALLCFSSLVPDARIASVHRVTAIGSGAALLVVCLAVAATLSTRLPPFVTPNPPDATSGSIGDLHPIALAGQLLSGLFHAVGSVAFTRHARRQADPVLGWIGAGMAVTAFSWLNYSLFPPVEHQWVYAPDLMRTAFHVLLLIGAAREIRGYWTALADAAVREERRRLARDLHDGVVQELGLIRRELQQLMHREPVAVADLQRAADRALEEARSAVDSLGRPADEPLGRALQRTVGDVARMHGLAVRMSLADVDAAPSIREALVRIAREATGNAARHGAAASVAVSLTRDARGYLLEIIDDGTGFDVEAATRAAIGYGLTTMRERASALGGELRILSAPRRGTSVQVRWT